MLLVEIGRSLGSIKLTWYLVYNKKQPKLNVCTSLADSYVQLLEGKPQPAKVRDAPDGVCESVRVRQTAVVRAQPETAHEVFSCTRSCYNSE